MSDIPRMITTLRKAFRGVDRIAPAGPTYARICATLDRADNDALKAVYAARIKFVSPLAFNRMIWRGIA